METVFRFTRTSTGEVQMSPAHGSYTLAAKALEVTYGKNSNGRVFTRQQMSAWYQRRHTNGFPEKHAIPQPDGKVKWLFSLTEVVNWYPTYHRSPGGRPRKE